MESNQHDHEYSKSSSEETDRSEQGNDDMGIGRSYECVFCKRGFTTAQALGGHMNIHRKERAKPARPNSVPSISSRAVDDDYTSFRAYPPIQSYPPHQYPAAVAHHHHDQEVHINYQTFFPASSTWGVRSPHHVQHMDDYYAQKPEYLNPFSEEHQLWRRNNNQSLQIGPSHSNHGSESKREDGDSIEEDELDLELRLGHDR